MKNLTKKSIVVSTYNRAELLEKCLESIISAQGFEEYKLIILHQIGSKEVELVLERYKNQIDFLCRVDGRNKTPLHNINWNRYATYSVAFDLYSSDFVLGIEDDTVIAMDALQFCDYAFEKFKNKRNFKGINLGSLESPQLNGSNTYSRIRYGLHGQAGVITKNVWNSFSSRGIPRNLATEPLDAMLEARLKTGYMVTSNRSRFLDFGWGGTHAPKSPTDSYYQRLQNSWVGSENSSLNFIEAPIVHTWREDSVLFSRRATFMARLRFMKYSLKIWLSKVKN